MPYLNGSSNTGSPSFLIKNLEAFNSLIKVLKPRSQESLSIFSEDSLPGMGIYTDGQKILFALNGTNFKERTKFQINLHQNPIAGIDCLKQIIDFIALQARQIGRAVLPITVIDPNKSLGLMSTKANSFETQIHLVTEPIKVSTFNSEFNFASNEDLDAMHEKNCIQEALQNSRNLAEIHEINSTPFPEANAIKEVRGIKLETRPSLYLDYTHFGAALGEPGDYDNHS